MQIRGIWFVTLIKTERELNDREKPYENTRILGR
jgi:hypothetical protein